MSPLETFFDFGFAATLFVVTLATLWCYSPALSNLYKLLRKSSSEQSYMDWECK